jgi:hypothetical protein
MRVHGMKLSTLGKTHNAIRVFTEYSKFTVVRLKKSHLRIYLMKLRTLGECAE